MESCGYKRRATAYPATLSTPPIESTVTRCTTGAPIPTTEIHGVDAVSRLPVHPRVANTKEEYGIRGGRRRKKEGRQTLGVCAVYKRVLVLERSRNFHFEHVGSLLVSWPTSWIRDQVSRQRYDFLSNLPKVDLV